ncbi:Fic family protein [Micromonospora sp. WMMA1949]|uniref:Fic family protein n=1 Tax=unclassified Micromonospora TaxID=2617518 RepID=UPI0022B6B198|nr:MULTISPECIES: Fic family protein [unclassified Micromonospora]MCZ7426068.1 Fic family protein [Micromonospora sp. WMMA1949]WBC10616.1 Fic family protein [Micromonospora sp. WMMA1947]
MIFSTPELSDHDETVLAEVHDMRRVLADVLRTPRRWTGGLRRTMLARAILGSNSIEGYVVAEDDAAAALDGEEPLSADDRTFAEIRGYRQALGYVLQTAGDPHFRFETSVIRSMHYMMLSHDLGKSPGQYRKGPIYVHDERTDERVYEGADADHVPHLMEELTEDLRSDVTASPLVKAAMAHLNLVMIHPFRDGNGRMARALQTLVLSRRAIVEPAFSSIEEWLGSNTEDYYRVLAVTGRGRWNPEGSARLWVSFNLRAHHMQAQTVARRFDEASGIWSELDAIVAEKRLPERVTDLLYEAVLGYRIRRSGYVKLADVEDRTASRDLANLVEQGLLEARGERRGRHYVAGPTLVVVRERVHARRKPIRDPYPAMPVVLATEAANSTGSGERL